MITLCKLPSDPAVLLSRTVVCPYCGEAFETEVDLSAGDHDYVEDCRICCRPIVFRIETDAAGALRRVEVRREDD